MKMRQLFSLMELFAVGLNKLLVFLATHIERQTFHVCFVLDTNR